ncbi:hypothetical protein FRB94_002960 [Tulasnella sp. JGI-2019a]|nr:hypothetical protein FRB94_002960 [Tulasnella sp. JGI-2019a]
MLRPPLYLLKPAYTKRIQGRDTSNGVLPNFNGFDQIAIFYGMTNAEEDSRALDMSLDQGPRML